MFWSQGFKGKQVVALGKQNVSQLASFVVFQRNAILADVFNHERYQKLLRLLVQKPITFYRSEADKLRRRHLKIEAIRASS